MSVARTIPVRLLVRQLALVGLALLATLPTLRPADAYPGAPWLVGGAVYTGNFPDPAVLLVDGTYYAYATNSGGAHIPVLTSHDLRTWTAPASGSTDALPRTAAWGVDITVGEARMRETWAPGVLRYDGRYLMFYALRMRAGPRRTCISIATARKPQGPFQDTSTAPVVCDDDPLGSIDPQPYVDPTTGAAYLTWKSEGHRGVTPTRLWAQRLDGTGTGVAAGAPRAMLLETALPWEGPIIENPSMLRYGDRWWLFYSANEWSSARYAVGYATCAGPLGPCTRATSQPLLTSTATRLGPGGAAAFVGTDGGLRLAYHYWNAPYTAYPPYPGCGATRTCVSRGQRRLAVLRLHRVGDERLAVG